MDENPAPAENTEVVEDNNQPASPADETNTSEDNQQPETDGQPSSAEETGEEPKATEESTERKPTRAERRIRELSQELKQYKEQPNQQIPGLPQSPQFPQYQPGEEIAPERLQADVVQTANAIASLQTQNQITQLEARMTLDRDIEVLPKTYPELDESSPAYNPVLEQKIQEQYKQRAFRNGQLDPSVRLADIARDYVEVAQAAATKSSAQTKNTIAQQVDEGAPRPSGSTRQDKPASEKSIEELEASLGFHKQ